MAIKSRENSIAAWAFLIGVIIAIIVGLLIGILASIEEIVQYGSKIYIILGVLGIITGLMIKIGGDAQNFLISGIIIIIASYFGIQSVSGTLIGVGIGDAVRSVFGALIALFVPATIIVALKTVFAGVRI